MSVNAFADLGAEKSVIGAILQDASCLRLLDDLRAEDFTCPEFAEIFLAAQRLRAKNQSVDAQTVHSELGGMGDVITFTFMLDAIRHVPTTVNVDSYAEIVRERSRRREIRLLCERTVQATAEGGADAGADLALDALRAMVSRSSTRITAAQVAAQTFELLESISNGNIRSIPTPLADLNTMLAGGLRNGEMTVLAAYTGQGKSALAQDIARNAAKMGFRVLLISGEMTAEQYGLRAFSSITGIDTATLLQAKRLKEPQWEAIGEAITELERLPIEFTFHADTVEDVRREARSMKKLDLLVVDYLQLLETQHNYPNDNSRVSHISRVLKQIARTLQIPVLALSQFSRPPKGIEKRPVIRDLRDSGSIEQDADNIWLMWQPTDGEDPDIPPNYAGWYEAAQDMGDRFMLLDIAKQRMGRLGVIGVGFSPRRMQFYTPQTERI